MIGIKTEKINIAPKSRGVPLPQDGEPIFKVERIATGSAVKRSIATAKKPEGQPAMSVAMADQFPWTINSIAEEFGMPTASFRAWKMKAEQAGKIVKPKVGSLFCIQDPESNRLRFSDAYVDKLKVLRGGTAARKKEVPASALQHAKLKILVPVFDEAVAKFLVKKFGSERAIEEYMKDHLIGLAKPALNKIEELKKKYDQEMASLMENF